MSHDELDLIWREVGRIATCMMVTTDGRKIRSRPMVGTADRPANTHLVRHQPDRAQG